jgi:hypothetical protein
MRLFVRVAAKAHSTASLFWQNAETPPAGEPAPTDGDTHCLSLLYPAGPLWTHAEQLQLPSKQNKNENVNCDVHESNPGRTRGRRTCYHYTNVASQIHFANTHMHEDCLSVCLSVCLSFFCSVSVSVSVSQPSPRVTATPLLRQVAVATVTR